MISDAWLKLEQALQEEIEQQKEPEPLQPVIVLVGSRLLARHLELQIYPELNQKGLGVNLKFLVFPELAQALYFTHPFPELLNPAGYFLKLLLAQDLLKNLDRNHYFSPVKDAAGLVQCVLNEHRDLQDGLIIGKEWNLVNDALKSGKHSRKLSSLFEIFSRLDQRLEKYEQDEKMFQTAISRADKFPQVFGTSRLLVYGFYDFTAIQKQLLQAVSRPAKIAAFMIQPENNDLFAGFAEKVLKFYQAELELKTEILNSAPGETDLFRLKKSLSRNERVDLKSDRTFSIVFAPGIDREVLEICREIIRLVQREGIRFDEIGILVRDYAGYARVLQEAFELYQIPYFLAPGKPLSDFSSARALLCLLRIPEEEYSRRSVINFFSSHALKSEWLKGSGAELFGWFDLISREALIVKGKEEWNLRLSKYLERMRKSLARAEAERAFEEETEEQREKGKKLLEKKIRSAEKLGEMAGALISELEEMRTRTGFQSLSESARKLCEKYLDLGFEGEEELKEKVEGIFQEIAELDRAGVAADYQTFLNLVAEGLTGETIGRGKFRQGGVCLSELMPARGVRFKAIILPGLCEGSFPLKLSENPLLSDDDRGWINHLCEKAGGVGSLAEKRKQPQEERLLFYLACHQADDFLILTSPWLELLANREKPASYLLIHTLERVVKEEVEFDRMAKLAEKHRGLIRWVELSGFAPEQEEFALNAEEWEESEIERATDLKEISHLLGGPEARRTIELAAERWLKEDFGLFTGYPGLDPDYDPRSFTILSQKISPSRLQDFLSCPFEYFLKRVLEVGPLEEPEYVWQFDRLAQGNLIHKILEGLFRKSTGDQARTREQFRKNLEQAIAGSGEPFLRAEYPAPEKLAKLELEQIYFYLLKWWRELIPDPEFKEWVIEKEVSEQPVKLELGQGRSVFLQGRIDRIDRSQTRACVNDYKVSKSVQQGGINQIQLPIYMLSVCNLFGYQPENVEGRFLVMVPEKLGEVEVIKKTGRNLGRHLEVVRNLVSRIADWIERGVFIPAAEDCGGCDYRLGCFATTAVYRKKKRNQLAGEINHLIQEIDFTEETDGK